MTDPSDIWSWLREKHPEIYKEWCKDHEKNLPKWEVKQE